MARTALTAFVAVRPGIDTVKIRGRGQANIDSFIAWLRETHPQVTSISVVDTDEEIVRRSDIVSFCSSGLAGDTSTYPLVKREWVKPGAYLGMPSLCEIDEGMQDRDVRKVADNIGLDDAWFHELPKPGHLTVPLIGSSSWTVIDLGQDGARRFGRSWRDRRG